MEHLSGRCQACYEKRKPAQDRTPYHRADGWFYSSARWRKARAEQLRRSPRCVQCGGLAEHVDHIQPRSQGGADLDAANLQSLCSPCHGRKTRAES